MGSKLNIELVADGKGLNEMRSDCHVQTQYLINRIIKKNKTLMKWFGDLSHVTRI